MNYKNPLHALSLVLLACLSACTEAPAPAAAAPVPILQDNQLRYPPGHPQLALLGFANAAPGKRIVVELPARIVWNEERTQRIYPAFSGRVIAIKADVGQQVRTGTLLAQLASPDFGMAQADTAKAGAEARLSQKSLQRQRELFEAGIIARKDLEQAEFDAARTQAENSRTDARTRLYGGTSGNVNQQLGLLASINGTVVERNLNPGQEVRPDQSGPGMPPLFVITDPTSLWVQIDARESEIGTLQVGSDFELVIPGLGGQKFDGRVTAVADFIDPATRTIKVRGVIANPARRLKAEMLATARLERQLGSGVVIPSQAVALLGSKHTVLVQTQPGVFESREVTVRYQGPHDTVVSRGLEANDQVVSENMLLLLREFRIAQGEAKLAVTTPEKLGKTEKREPKDPLAQSNPGPSAAKAVADQKASQAKP